MRHESDRCPPASPRAFLLILTLWGGAAPWPASSSSVGRATAQETFAVRRERSELFPHRPLTSRPPDDRPVWKEEVQKVVPVRTLRSRHLLLYTDLPTEEVASIPKVTDELYAELERYFGRLPPAPDQKAFQVSGYVMANPEKFREAGLLPADLRRFLHGRHRGQEYWIYDQKLPYFRRHLALHEFTHCYMLLIERRDLPLWYTEGMAELFATHQEVEGRTLFRRIPTSEPEFLGHGRIRLLREDPRRMEFLRDITRLERIAPEDFLRNEAYAWSWAACLFCDQHPLVADDFREARFALSPDEFHTVVAHLQKTHGDRLGIEWAAFALQLDYGYDLVRSANVYRDPLPWDGRRTSPRLTAEAGKGWQGTGCPVKEGVTYRVRATGRTTLGREPRPWVSEADGISIDYYGGHPIGRLMGWVVQRTPGRLSDAVTPPVRENIIPLGGDTTFTAPRDGELFLRVNDAWNSLADDEGAYDVTIERVSAR